MDINSIINAWHIQDKIENIPYQNYDSKRQAYGFYTNIGDVDESLSKNKRIFNLKYRNHILYINLTKCNNKSFIFNVAVLCHEMIHYYDALYGQYKKFQQISYLKNKPFKDHSTPIFIQLKRKARHMEIPVSSFVNDDWSNMSDEEFMEAVKFFDESEININWDDLKSTDTVKVGPRSIRFISTGMI